MTNVRAAMIDLCCNQLKRHRTRWYKPARRFHRGNDDVSIDLCEPILLVLRPIPNFLIAPWRNETEEATTAEICFIGNIETTQSGHRGEINGGIDHLSNVSMRHSRFAQPRWTVSHRSGRTQKSAAFERLEFENKIGSFWK